MDIFVSKIFLFIPGANFVFSIYDFEGCGTVDAVNLGDMLRALNLNPTLATIEKLGGTKKKSKHVSCDIHSNIFYDSILQMKRN